MTTITTDFGSGGANLTPNYSSGAVDLTTTLRDVADDVAALRAAVVGVTAKLDAEDVALMDTDYASLHDPPAMKTTKA